MDEIRAEFGIPADQEFHVHLAAFGHVICRVPGCPRPADDPDLDMDCTDPACDGNCEASKHNYQRRMHLIDGSGLS